MEKGMEMAVTQRGQSGDMGAQATAEAAMLLGRLAETAKASADAEGEGLARALTRCDVSNTARETGLQGHDGGILKLNDTNVHNESKIGIVIGNKGVCEVAGGTFNACGQAAIVVMPNGSLNIFQCTIDGCGQFSISQSGGRVCSALLLLPTGNAKRGRRGAAGCPGGIVLKHAVP